VISDMIPLRSKYFQVPRLVIQAVPVFMMDEGHKHAYPGRGGGAVATGAFEIYISLYLFVVFGVFTYLVISRVALAIANVVRQWAIPALREPMTEALSTKQGSGYWYKVWPQRLLGWNLGAGDAALCAV